MGAHSDTTDRSRRGHSSVGRALAWHARGPGFESQWLHSDFFDASCRAPSLPAPRYGASFFVWDHLQREHSDLRGGSVGIYGKFEPEEFGSASNYFLEFRRGRAFSHQRSVDRILTISYAVGYHRTALPISRPFRGGEPPFFPFLLHQPPPLAHGSSNPYPHGRTARRRSR